MSDDSDEESQSSNFSDGFENFHVRAGTTAAISAAEVNLRDVTNDFEVLENDVLRQEGGEGSAAESEEEFDFFSSYGDDSKKKKKKEANQEGQDDSDLIEMFDFRRGPKHWPRGVEIITEEKGRELVDKAVEEANKKQEKEKQKGSSSGSKAKYIAVGGGDDELFPGSGSGKPGEDEDGEGEDGAKREGGGKKALGPDLPPGMGPGFMSASSDEEELLGPDDDLLDPAIVAQARLSMAPPEAKFEFQRDRSTALVIQPGMRLKLDITGLTQEGKEKKAKAERTRLKEALMSKAAKERAEAKAKNKKKRYGGYSFYDADWEKEWAIKHYVNEYTITFDVKLKREAPREGLALFQTSLVYTEENPSSGRKTIKQSDGECVIGSNGGVGVFGQLGDVTKAKIIPDRWRRVVISIKNVGDNTKGEMRTWIDSVPCAVIKRDAFQADGRFALDAESLYLFSSQKASMMPGDILLRYIRIERGFSTDELVRENHATDKVLSMHEEERAERAEEQRKGLSLAPLFPKPRPLWTAPTLVGAVGDPFIERTTYEGSSVLCWSFKVLNFAMRRAFELQPEFLHGLTHEERSSVSDVLQVLHQSSPLMQQMLKLLMTPNDSSVISYLNKLRKYLNTLGVGESLMVPVVIEHSELVIIVHRTAEQMYRFVIVETDAERGLNNHPSNPSLGPKIKYRTCLVLSNIPKKNALDNVFWMAVYNLSVSSGKNDLMRFYDVLIPFLTGKPLETSLWESEEAALQLEDDAILEKDYGVIGDWTSPQRSYTPYVRTFLHAVRYMLRSRGLGVIQSKQVVLALRAQLVQMLDNDLQYVSVDDNGQRVCRIACNQLNYATVKLVDSMKKAKLAHAEEYSNLVLQKAKKITDSVEEKVSAYVDVQTDLPPALDLREKLPVEDLEKAKEEDPEEIKRKAMDESELHKEDRSGKHVELTIRHGPNGVLKIKLYSTSKVAHLQTRIAMQLGVGMDEQRLIYMGRLLKPEATIEESGLAAMEGLTVQLNVSKTTNANEEDVLAHNTGPDAKPEDIGKSWDEKLRKIRSALRRDPEAPAMKTQFMDGLAWDCEQTDPNPGMAVSLRKYVPIDMLQMPAQVNSREEAIMAIRLCDRLCTLMDNQPHCVKNDRFLIAALIQHTFTQLVPFPKPRAVDTNKKDAKGRPIANVSSRRERRKLRKLQKKEKKALKRSSSSGTKSDTKDNDTTDEKKEEETTIEIKEKPTRIVDEQPDFARGSSAEAELTSQECMWDQDIEYALQVELMLVLTRICEHFVASVFSIRQDRPFDSVIIVTMGCITAIADAVMRRRATDLPSEVCSHLLGQTRDGRQLGVPGYGISTSSFATQTETIESHTPELCIARTAVLDYFLSPQQRRLEKIFNWERHYELRPDRELIKYLRAIQREIAYSDPNPHLFLLDGSPVEQSLIKRNYPELRCFRDIVFFWKCLMNPDVKAFPNWIDTRREDHEIPSSLGRFGRLQAQLHWQWEQSNTTAGYLVYCSYQGIILKCRPEPDRDAKGETFSKERQPPSHRFPSTATPSFYIPDPPPIRTEDDVIYRPNLPGFEDDHVAKKRIKALLPKGSDHSSASAAATTRALMAGAGLKGKKAKEVTIRQQILGQHDSELLISFLTVPYLRLPLVLTFFASDDRLHKLQSHKLRNILDSVMFEPGRYLALDLVGVAPTMVPTPHQNLLATPFGLLLNELVRSPDTVLIALDTLLEGALALDTGSVCDLGELDFNVSVDIILYIARLGARCESYVSFLIAIAKGEHDCYAKDMMFRDLQVTKDCLAKLEMGRTMLRRRLLKDFGSLLEDYLRRLDHETKSDPNNEKLIDRNSRLAADLHAVKILFHRNTRPEEYDIEIAREIIGSFVFLTTRHTWNKMTRSQGLLLAPETELYEVLQVQRRRLIMFCRSCQQGPLDKVMQSALQVATSSTGSYRATGEVVDAHNRWARIAGERSIGRFAVGSTRTVGEDESSVVKKLSSSVISTSKDGKGIPLTRQRSLLSEVAEVPDSGVLGVELDLQIGQMTLRSKHLSALPSDVANHPDMRRIFGTATMQASLLERATNRTIYRLVGLNHDIHYWSSAHLECPPIPESFERQYDPAELFDSESWIPALFEPVRKSFFNGPQPPPMEFLMLERPLPDHAEVAVLVGVHQALGGMAKLVYIFRRLRCVHVYQSVSHGRRFYWTLHLTTDVRYTYREMQPSFAPRYARPPQWWRRGAGQPYPPGEQLVKHMYDDIVSAPGANPMAERSVLIVRDRSHPDNLSNGLETLVPSRFLMGLVPQTLLDSYTFWCDQSGSTTKQRLGYMRMMGYPNDAEDEFIVMLEIQLQTNVEATGHLPARTVRAIRRLKVDVVKECEQKRRLAEVLEQTGLLVRENSKAAKLARKLKRKKKSNSQRSVTKSQEDEDDGGEGDDEEEEEGESASKSRKGKRDRDDEGEEGGEGDDEDEEDDEEDEEDEKREYEFHELSVGLVVEYAVRLNNWCEASITAVHEEDGTVDVELRGDVNNGLTMSRVHPRDIRKKQIASDQDANKDDENDDDGGNNNNLMNTNAFGQTGGSLFSSSIFDTNRKKSASKGGRRRIKTNANQNIEGRGIWYWEGISDSDDEDWASTSSSDEDDKGDKDDDDANKRAKKNALSFAQMDLLPLLLEACDGDETLCLDTLRKLPAPPRPFTSVMRLARVLQRYVHSEPQGQEPSKNLRELRSHLKIASSDNDFILLNLLYAPKGSRLYSLMKALSRVENLSHIVAWTKASNLTNLEHSQVPHDGVPPIDLVELPRLKLSFTARPDHMGVIRLYSLDHADLYVSNERSVMTNRMLDGIPHSLLMCNTQGETSVLVPVVSMRRPQVYSEPFSTWMVLHRMDTDWNSTLSQRYFLYPVHVSLSFMMSKGIDSGLYLLLLRFLNRDYTSVFRLADSIATDTAFSPAGQLIFHSLALANDDWHPDAHACRLKISLVTIDSGVKLPWDLTLQCARYIIKLSHVSASCRISLEEELQLLETEDAIAYEVTSPAYRALLHTPYVRALVRNRQQALSGSLNGKDKVSCYAPPRTPLTNWPYYVDNTVFGVVYEEMTEIKNVEEFEDILKGQDDLAFVVASTTSVTTNSTMNTTPNPIGIELSE